MEEKFLQLLKDTISATEDLTFDTELVKIEVWDSLSVVTFGAMALTEYDVLLTAGDVAQARTVGDLYCLVEDRVGQKVPI